MVSRDAVACASSARIRRAGEVRVAQQAGRVGEAEQLGEVQQAARALLPADHGEVVWWPLSQAMNTTPVL